MTILELVQEIYYAQYNTIISNEEAFEKCDNIFENLQFWHYLKRGRPESSTSHGRGASDKSRCYPFTLTICLFPEGIQHTITKKASCRKMFVRRLVSSKNPEPAAVAAIIKWFFSEFKRETKISLRSITDKKKKVTVLEYKPGIVENIIAYMQGKAPVYLFQLTDPMIRKIRIVRESILFDSPDTKNHVESELEKITDWHFELDKQVNSISFLKHLGDEKFKKLSNKVIDEKLTEAAKEYPVYDSLYAENRLSELRSFLSLNCILKIDRELNLTVSMRWSISSFLENIQTSIDEVTMDSCYTRADLFEVLGELARRATAVYEENMSFSKLYSVPLSEEDNHVFHSFHEEELNLAEKAGLIEISTETITFTHKRFRIIFSAINKAEHDNMLPLEQVAFDVEGYREDRDSENYGQDDFFERYGQDEFFLNTVTDRALQNGEQDKDAESYVQDKIVKSRQGHLLKRYNWATVYFTIYADFLNSDKREAFFEALVSYALEYKTGSYKSRYDRRELQMKAIQILTYYLYAGAPFPFKKEAKLFHAAYGENLYPIQAILINEFLKKRPCYEKLIREGFAEACKIKDGIAETQPNYIFLQCLFPDDTDKSDHKRFFYSAAKWHNHFYRQMGVKDFDEVSFRYLFAEIAQTGAGLKYFYQNLPSSVDENNLLWYVYGLQLYAYMFGNILLNQEQPAQALNGELNYNPQMAQSIAESFIYADYYSRKLNPKYRYGNYYERHNTTEKMFLLCGPIRYFCQHHQVDRLILLPEEMKHDYLTWLSIENEEYPRYSFLLMNLLYHTDTNFMKLIPDRKVYNKISFLPYDCMETDYDELYKRFSRWSF